MINQVTQYDTVARIADTGQAVVILQYGEERCYVSQCYGTNNDEKKEYGILTKELRKF